ncbi:tRNA (guanosine(46)-N7)-methyltransferase TrmB [Candidatus Pantoea carbekii]|nr:tRNA (guanosine(46)-N7)-methyltransferase TrmB [Candidatus Pantoea carbekii]AKC32560.1 tRNA (guanine-N(7)-)-methyltransferase TrmB [Candidatus Pantoea carbekii]
MVNNNLIIFEKFHKCFAKQFHYIRSFTCRHRRLTKAQQFAFENYWQEIGIEFQEQQLDLITLFGGTSPIILEIGFGTGNSLVKMAKDNPNHNFIGIEVYKRGIGSCLLSAKKAGITNLRLIYYDAVQVIYRMIPDNALYVLQLFFPDPWHKVRHNKRRIIQKPFIELIMKKLNLGGILHIVTDCEAYVNHIIQIMNSVHGYSYCSLNNYFINQHKTHLLTKFEQRARILNHNICTLIFERVR